MKKFKKILYSAISVCVCAVLVFASGCSTPPLTGNLFDEKVLEKAKIPFLTKPENPIEETYKIAGEAYYYACYSDDLDYLFEYTEEQFNQIISAGYTTACFDELIDTGDMITIGETYFLLNYSSTYIDFERKYEKAKSYSIYYSTDKLYELDKYEGRGFIFYPNQLTFTIYHNADEQGYFKLTIHLGGKSFIDKSKYYINCD